MLVYSKENSKNVLIRLAIILLCYLGSCVSNIMNIDLLIMVLCVVFAFMTIDNNPLFVLKYSALLIPVALGIFGVYFIENSKLWLVELQRRSHYCGSLPLFAAFYLTFILALEIIDSHFIKHRVEQVRVNTLVGAINGKKTFLMVFGWAFFIVTLCMLLRVMVHPYYLVHMDRFEYQKEYITGIWQKIHAYYFYFFPFVLINITQSRTQKRLSIATIAMYVFYLFLQGEKFGGYITICLYCTLYFIPTIKRIKKKKMRRLYRVLILVLILALCIVLLQYNTLFGSASPIERLEQRVAQQGQLWWAIYDRQQSSVPHIDEFYDELDAFTDSVDNPTPYYAIYKMMYLSAPKQLITNKIATGSTYTESSAASLYYYFGWAVLPLFAVICGWLFAYLANKYYVYIKANRIIEVVIIARLISLSRSFFSMSRFTWLFTPDTLFTVAILWIMFALRKLHYRKDHRLETKEDNVDARGFYNCSSL